MADLCREHGISAATLYGWKAKYVAMDVSEAQRLKQREDENRRLTPSVADLILNQEVLKADADWRRFSQEDFHMPHL